MPKQSEQTELYASSISYIVFHGLVLNMQSAVPQLQPGIFNGVSHFLHSHVVSLHFLFCSLTLIVLVSEPIPSVHR